MDENKNQPRELIFGTHINFNVHIKIPVIFFPYQLSSVVNSCQQLETVNESENQPKELLFGTHITLWVCIKHPAQHSLYQLI